MIATILRHYIYDMGISMLFDTVASNFVTAPVGGYLDRYWIAYDKTDGEMVTFGYCKQDEGSLIVLDNADGEYIVSTQCFRLVESSEKECDELDGQVRGGNLEWVEYIE